MFDTELLPEEGLWWTTKWGEEGRSKVLITLHMRYVDEEMMHMWYDETAQNVERWLKGEDIQIQLV